MKNIVNLTLKTTAAVKKTAFLHYGLLLTDAQAKDIMACHRVHKDVPFEKLIKIFLEHSVGR
ncbi:MAG: hypothetical protein U9P10_16145 [Thermodesulfobacteriota bacterium]|nr:hypothetical protein [Thermodesulfobacteriota bacterium]